MANIKRLNQLMERGDENIGYQEWHDFLIDRTASIAFSEWERWFSEYSDLATSVVLARSQDSTELDQVQ